MSTFFNIIQPISNLPVFIFLNLLICGIVIHWYWSIVTGNFSERAHRWIQRFGLFISILVIGILFVRQWNIGDLLAFYSIFSLGILIFSLVKGHKEIIKESRGWFLSIFLVFFIRGYVYEPWQIPSGSMKPNLEVGDFVHTFGDAHIYNNHIDQINLQLSREPRKLPTLKIKRKVESIFDFKFEDFEIINYNPHPHIKGLVSV